MKSGVLNLKKEANMTSHDAVRCIRNLFQTKKVGHTGTLDPEATGVLPILIGSATKACDLVPGEEKVYRAGLRFGISTFTQDIWGEELERSDARASEETFRKAMESFVGESFQIPPMVSAVKIGGKKLYEYAREGKTVERKPRKIFVHSMELISFSSEKATLRIRVSKGTYIRTLLWDICEKLGVLGTMNSLVREQSGMFSLADAVTLKELEEMTPESRERMLVPTEQLFLSYPVFHLPPFFDKLILSGQGVLTRKLGLSSAEPGERFRLYQGEAFLALGEIFEGEEGRKLKKIKEFQ